MRSVRAFARGGRRIDLPPGVGGQLIRDPAGGLAGGAGGEDVARDPDGLFKGVPLKSGIIERRLMQKRIEQDKDFAKAMESASDELRKQAILRREMRKTPENDEELAEHFLNTVAEDMEFEVARYRPRLTPSFFRYLDGVIGSERFSEKPDEDRLAELDLLRKYLGEAAQAVDKCVESTASAKERVMKLLTAKDKKQMILDMAAANEIDQALMDLLQQNIDAARAAEQEDAAKFMEKVKQAAAKYFVTEAPAAAALPTPPPPPPTAKPAAVANSNQLASGLHLPAGTRLSNML